MGQIVKTFLGIAFSMILMVTGISVITMQADGVDARNFKNDVISEMETSDFNPDVINACFNTANEKGYNMEVAIYKVTGGTPQTYSTGNVAGTSGAAMARVKLKYNVSILGRELSKSIEGCTR